MSILHNAGRKIISNKGKTLLLCTILFIITATVGSFIKSAWPQSRGAIPHPMDAVKALVKAFEKNQLVALGDVHGLDQERAFTISLVKNPIFAATVQSIVIETGNAKYQALVDNYLNGEAIQLEELQKVWRDLSVSGMGPTDTMSNQALFEAIRSVNQKLAPSKRLHVYLGDPPIDWKKVKTHEDVEKWLSQRDTYLASVIEKQIYAKGIKGLLIVGEGHLRRNENSGVASTIQELPTNHVNTPGVQNPQEPTQQNLNTASPTTKQPTPVILKTMLQIIEEKHPDTVYVIFVHTGFGSKNNELEPELQAWPIPSIASIQGTWIGELDSSYDSLGSAMFGTGSKSANPLSGRKKEADIDGYLYLGSVKSFTITQPLPEIYKNDAYFYELNRRHLLTMGTPLNRQDLLKEKPTNYLENYQEHYQSGGLYP